MLRLGLTDAPTDAADAVRVTVSSVEIRRGGNEPCVGCGAGSTPSDRMGAHCPRLCLLEYQLARQRGCDLCIQRYKEGADARQVR